MPQASDELRAEWDGPNDEKAIAYLEERGYIDVHFYWKLPSPNHVPTEKELSAIQFLMDEWDWGGVVTDEELADIEDGMNRL